MRQRPQAPLLYMLFIGQQSTPDNWHFLQKCYMCNSPYKHLCAELMSLSLGWEWKGDVPCVRRCARILECPLPLLTLRLVSLSKDPRMCSASLTFHLGPWALADLMNGPRMLLYHAQGVGESCPVFFCTKISATLQNKCPNGKCKGITLKMVFF